MDSPGVYVSEQDFSNYVVTQLGMIAAVVGVADSGSEEPVMLTGTDDLIKKYGTPVYMSGQGREEFAGYAAHYLIESGAQVIFQRVLPTKNGVIDSDKCAKAKAGNPATDKFVFYSKYYTDKLNGYKIEIKNVADSLSVGLQSDVDYYSIKFYDSSDNLLESFTVNEVVGSTDFVENVVNNQSGYLEVVYTSGNTNGLAAMVTYNTSTPDYHYANDVSKGPEPSKIGWKIEKAGVNSIDLVLYYNPDITIIPDVTPNADRIIVSISDDEAPGGVISAADLVTLISEGGNLSEFISATLPTGSGYGTGEYTIPSTGMTIHITRQVEGQLTMSGGLNDLVVTGTDYAYALDKLSNSETVDFNTLVIPGNVAPAGLDLQILSSVKTLIGQRKDFTFVWDTPKGYKVDAAVTWANENTLLNDSYIAVYGPWVKMYDKFLNKERLFPPSMFAAGQYAYNDSVKDAWWAAAGFNRGIIQVATGVEYSPTKLERDKLYGNSVINPIVNFKGVGIVIFGNKTTYRKPSYLNRVSVRRLTNLVRKILEQSTKYYLFDPNDEVSWRQWVLDLKPIFEKIKTGRGFYDYKLVMDKTTVSAQDIAEGRMPGKALIQPTVDAQFIPIDIGIYKYGDNLG